MYNILLTIFFKFTISNPQRTTSDNTEKIKKHQILQKNCYAVTATVAVTCYSVTDSYVIFFFLSNAITIMRNISYELNSLIIYIF